MIHAGNWHVWAGWALALALVLVEVMRWRRRRAAYREG